MGGGSTSDASGAGCHPGSYPSPLRFARCRPRARRSPFPRYVWGPKPKRRTELGLLLFGSLLIVALYVIAVLGEKSKIPAQHRALPRHRARAGADRPHGEPLARPQRQCRDPPAGRAAQRHRLRRSSPAGTRAQARARPAGPRSASALYVLTLLVVRYSRDLERYRYLLLLAGRHAPGGAAVLLPHRRRAPVGPLRQPLVPAGRVLQDPAVHLLRLVLRGEQGDALHPDRAGRQPPLPRPPAPAPHPRGLGRRHGRHRRSRTTSASPPCSSSCSSACCGWPPAASATWSSGSCSSAWAPTSRRTTSARCTCACRRVAEPVADADHRTRAAASWPGLVQHGHGRRRRHRPRASTTSPARSPS